MKISEVRLKQLIREEVEGNDALLRAIEALSDKIENLDVSIDYMAAAVTGEDPLALGVGQKSLGRSYVPPKRRPPPPAPPEISEDEETTLKQIVKEELQIHLLKEELVRLNEVCLNEGVMSYLSKLFGGDKEKWKEIVDGASTGKSAKEILPDKKTFLSMPTKEQGAMIALVAILFAGGMDFATKYYDVSAQSATAAEMIRDSVSDAAERAQNISNFREMAIQDAGAEGDFGGIPTDQDGVDKVMNAIRANYALQDAPLDPAGGMGHATGQGQATDYAFVPAADISDSTVLPFSGMTKGDFETLLRVQWLAGAGGGDQQLIDYVTGGDKPGSSTFWSYQDSMQAPVVDERGSSPEMQDQMLGTYGDVGKTTLILPLEWSVAYDVLQQRHAAGRI